MTFTKEPTALPKSPKYQLMEHHFSLAREKGKKKSAVQRLTRFSLPAMNNKLPTFWALQAVFVELP